MQTDPGSARHIPRRIDVRREAGEMWFEWKDGTSGRIGLAELRRLCPCAICDELREQQRRQDTLHMLTESESSATAEVQSVIPVGRYAIQVRWRDGHDTGIYTYAYLRRLVEEQG